MYTIVHKQTYFKQTNTCNTNIHSHTHTHTHTHAQTHTQTHTLSLTNTHTHKHKYTHSHTHTQTRTQTHVYYYCKALNNYSRPLGKININFSINFHIHKINEGGMKKGEGERRLKEGERLTQKRGKGGGIRDNMGSVYICNQALKINKEKVINIYIH